MINMQSKYDDMHKNGMNYAVKCSNNHVISSISYMLLVSSEGIKVGGAKV